VFLASTGYSYPGYLRKTMQQQKCPKEHCSYDIMKGKWTPNDPSRWCCFAPKNQGRSITADEKYTLACLMPRKPGMETCGNPSHQCEMLLDCGRRCPGLNMCTVGKDGNAKSMCVYHKTRASKRKVNFVTQMVTASVSTGESVYAIKEYEYEKALDAAATALGRLSTHASVPPESLVLLGWRRVVAMGGG
jgi:hypothetical protein